MSSAELINDKQQDLLKELANIGVATPLLLFPPCLATNQLTWLFRQ